MIQIKSWYGRLGNNIVQLLNAIHYAKSKGHAIIRFPKHQYLKSQEITISSGDSSRTVGLFFSLKKEFDMAQPSPEERRSYARLYIRPIIRLPKVSAKSSEDVVIHIRSGDIFGSNPHRAYVPAPLTFYTDIIKNYSKAYIVYEDMKNPVVSRLKLLNNTVMIHGNVMSDLSHLVSAKNLVLSYGTFGPLAIYLGEPEHIHVTDYNNIRSFPEIKFTVHQLPGYIKPGTWHNNSQQRKKIIEYRGP